MLTLEQRAENAATLKHIQRVRDLLNQCAVELLRRGEQHDRSKLDSPEVEVFTEFGPKLSQCHYNSPEEAENKRQMKPALDHHYANNRHHPEHFEHGINDMTLIDVLEMLMDWKASSERQLDGNIRHSLQVNTSRFGITPQLLKILENTVEVMFA